MTEYNGNFDLLVLGNGICAQSILFEMTKDDKFNLDTLSVAQIFSDSVFSPCSKNTTSVVGLNGTTKGNSDLGDLIVDSYFYTEDYFEKYNFESVHKGTHFFLCPDPLTTTEYKISKFYYRHGPTGETLANEIPLEAAVDKNFVVDADSLSDELTTEIINSNIKRINSFITDIDLEQKLVKTLDGKVYKAQNIICTLGAYTKNSLFKEDISYTKVVPGDYLTFNNCDLGKNSFVISSGHHNLVYRAFSKTVLIGGTTLTSQWDAIDFPEISEQYTYYRGILGDKLPAFSNAKIRSGLRHKGRRRRPFCGEIAPGVFSLHGVYKNGYTFSFYLGHKLLKQLEL